VNSSNEYDRSKADTDTAANSGPLTNTTAVYAVRSSLSDMSRPTVTFPRK